MGTPKNIVQTGVCQNNKGNCSICNAAFHQEQGKCSKGHKAGSHYRWTTGVGWKNSIVEVFQCQQEGGSRCSLCHQQIGDGDDICVRGHEIGHWYTLDQVQHAAAV